MSTAQCELRDVIEQDTTCLSIPSQLEWVGVATNFLQQRAGACGVCDESRSGQLGLVLHEALTNAIIHGNLGVSSALKEAAGDEFAQAVAQRSADPKLSRRRVHIQFGFDGEYGRICITDEGDGFDHHAWLAKLDAASDDEPSLESSGRGILLMRAFSDAIEFFKGGREVAITLKRPNSDERRAAGRRPWTDLVRVVAADDDGRKIEGAEWSAAFGRNISSGGISFVQAGVEASKRVLIELNASKGGESPTYVSAEVCQVQMLEGGLMQLGCRFQTAEAPVAHTDAPASLEELLDTLERENPGAADEAGNGHERREHPRIPYSAALRVRQNGSEQSYPAFSRDLSRGGLAMVTAHELKAGQVDIEFPPHTVGEEARTVRATIVRCQRVSRGVYDIGCRFL